MDSQQFFPYSKELQDSLAGQTLSDKERESASLLLVDGNNSERRSLRYLLGALGFNQITDVNSHTLALGHVIRDSYTYILFSTEETDMNPDDFVREACAASPKSRSLALAAQASLRDVFRMLRLGTRGFLIKPYTPNNVDYALLLAARCDPVTEAILSSDEPGGAFAAASASHLDKLAAALIKAREGKVSSAELQKLRYNLQESVHLGKTFSEGGVLGFQEALQEYFSDMAREQPTRLGQLRRRLQSLRGGPQQDK